MPEVDGRAGELEHAASVHSSIAAGQLDASVPGGVVERAERAR